MNKISVLMSIYNEPVDWIVASLLSIINQDIKDFSIQLIVIIDDPSRKDELDNVLKKLISGAEVHYKSSRELILHYNQVNIGLAKSLNFAFKLSDGEYIARMDADDISSLHRFSEQIEYLHATNSDLVGAGIERMDAAGNKLGVSILSSDFNSLKKHLGYKSICYHPTWFMKRHVFKSLDGYRPYPNSQDLDFIIRAVEAGFVISNIPSILLQYRLNSASLSFSKSLRQRKCQNHIVKLAKYRKRGLLDYYNECEMLKYINSSKQYEAIHGYSQKFYVDGINLLRRKKYIGAIYVIFSMVISPMQAKFVFSLTLNKLRRVYEK